MTLGLLVAGFAVGLLAKRLRWVDPATPQWLNHFIINLALPAMILLKVPTLVLDGNALVPVAAAWLVILSSAGVLLILARYYRWSPDILGALLLVVPLTNSAYLGLPLLNALTSDVMVAYGAFYDQFGNFLALSVYAPAVIALVGNDTIDGRSRVRARDVVLRMMSFIPFPVLVVSVAFLDANSLPDWSLPGLELLAATMGPLAAFIVGFSLRFSVPASLQVPLAAGLCLRLVFAPALVWIVAAPLPLAPPAVAASVLQAAMPSMITAGLIGIAAGYSERLIVAMLSLSTVLSLITLSGLFRVLS